MATSSAPLLTFALIGDHPHGVAMTRAMINAGHSFAAYAGPEHAEAELRTLASTFNRFRDVEEVLARRDIELVIVADDLAHRPAMLRRAMQSEKHVLCVFPPDLKPDAAFEAAMIQNDTRKVLLPILPGRLAPGLEGLKQFQQEQTLGAVKQVVYAIRHPSASASPIDDWEKNPLLSMWEELRHVGGEIAELSALGTTAAELLPNDQLTVTGRFESGGLFQVTLSPTFDCARRLQLQADRGKAELVTPNDAHGPSKLVWETNSASGAGANYRPVEFPAYDPWDRVAIEVQHALVGAKTAVGWLDAIRCLELFDSVKYSVKYGRVAPMHYQEQTEEASFKGIMTSLGCGLLWLVLVMMFVGVWQPWLWRAIPFVLALFLALQAFRWILPSRGENPRKTADFPDSADGNKALSPGSGRLNGTKP